MLLCKHKSFQNDATIHEGVGAGFDRSFVFLSIERLNYWALIRSCDRCYDSMY